MPIKVLKSKLNDLKLIKTDPSIKVDDFYNTIIAIELMNNSDNLQQALDQDYILKEFDKVFPKICNSVELSGLKYFITKNL
mmetsp:Transcript_30679/g.27872  ORF Transcript_30679/g.27872 Transcript_30679/m.27872 type:complete len:81 (-) Transcript_30679:1326-1568(-)